MVADVCQKKFLLNKVFLDMNYQQFIATISVNEPLCCGPLRTQLEACLFVFS